MLCTDSESFELKEAEISNSLLILPECHFTAKSLDNAEQPTAISRQVCVEFLLSYAICSLVTTLHSCTSLEFKAGLEF